MGVTSETPTSRRGYLSESELEQFADITVTDSNEGADRISQAEEMIDGFVGYVCKFMEYEITGRVSSAQNNSLTLESDQQNIYDVDFFKWCEVEIIGGTGANQRRRITGSTKEGVLTVDSNWTTALDTTSFYKIYQLGKFPRREDVTSYSEQAPTTYYKQIPENVKRAVAAQVAFMIEMGDSFFAGDESDKISERIGDYSYVKAEKSGGEAKLIAPRAKMLLRGYTKRIGQIRV